MTDAQKIWLETYKGWERQLPASRYLHHGIVDRDGKFSLAPSSYETASARLKDGDILVGIPA